uniref:Uncharacterized protein n=1 Tax=Rhizophora mucronata TaxID=61149 RepID=A0A2P2PGP0_RHIMU
MIFCCVASFSFRCPFFCS